MKIKILFIILFLLVFPLVLAETSYYAKINMYFNVPSDASFKVGFPSTYTGSYNVTAANDTVTPWISFNFTAATETWVEPRTEGDGSLQQNGNLVPIFLVHNIGNANIDIDINATVPATFAVCANSTCTGSCSGTTSSCTALSGTFSSMGTGVQTNSKLNISLWGNATGASGGKSTGDVFLRSKLT